MPVALVHLAPLGGVVLLAHYPVGFLGLFLLFLGSLRPALIDSTGWWEGAPKSGAQPSFALQLRARQVTCSPPLRWSIRPRAQPPATSRRGHSRAAD